MKDQFQRRRGLIVKKVVERFIAKGQNRSYDITQHQEYSDGRTFHDPIAMDKGLCYYETAEGYPCNTEDGDSFEVLDVLEDSPVQVRRIRGEA